MEFNIEMGANGYIRKPFDAEELFLAVEKCLNAEWLSAYKIKGEAIASPLFRTCFTIARLSGNFNFLCGF